MSSTVQSLALLRCPFCSSRLETSVVLSRRDDGGIEYGILDCQPCKFSYPIVAGVVIMMAPHEAVDSKFETSELTSLEGPRVAVLAELIKTRQPLEAFALLLNPATLAGDWFTRLSADGASADGHAEHALLQKFRIGVEQVRRKSGRLAKRYGLPLARRRLATFLDAHAERLSAWSAMDLYYRRYSNTENFNYFAYRLGQPRHLAALCLASLSDATEQPVLDLACGVGHLTHYLSNVQPQRAVVGIDREFFRLWVGHRYIAPGALFVCASADRPLPFDGATFAGVFCSDAFHYFLNRAFSVREMQRVLTPDGILSVARFGNAALEPHEGYELELAGYQRLFADVPHVFLDESSLLASYLAQRGPDLARDPQNSGLAGQKWLSVVATRREEVFQRGATLPSRPHAVGKLVLNPIYEVATKAANGDVELRFKFPSHWYGFENQAYLSYAPEVCWMPAHVFRALTSQEPVPELQAFIDQLVVIGAPENYV